jgi:molybdenum cofactor cytidylyltransferase
MRAPDRTTIPAIVLAAGQSRRMGRPKCALPAGGHHTFASRIAATLSVSGLSPIVFVTSTEGRRDLDRALGQWRSDVVTIENPHPERGQLSTLRCALEQTGLDLPVALLTLVDVPFTTPQAITALIDAWREHRAPLVRPSCGSRHGHPILVGTPVLNALATADPGTQTMRDVVAMFEGECRDVAMDEAWRLADTDTPEEYEAALRELTSRERMSGGPGGA